jgi:hypothetical protein
MSIFSLNYLIFLLSLVTLLVAVIIFINKKFRYLKGKAGERFVRKQLSEKLNSEHYKILNNLLLPSQNKLCTTQIDHVIVSNYGIFCIETKNFKGLISGDSYEKDWFQNTENSENPFPNPVRQNWGHIKTLKELLSIDYPEAPIESLIAFPGADKLRIYGTNSVGYVKDIISEISSHTELIFSNEDVSKIFEIIKKANITGINGWAIRRWRNQKIQEIKNSR